MSDIPSFSYDWLWGERTVKSVANLTRSGRIGFFDLLEHLDIKTETRLFQMQDANDALGKFRTGKISGAAVLVMEDCWHLPFKIYFKSLIILTMVIY